MCFETRTIPEKIKGGERLTSEDIRELFERYGSQGPARPVLNELAEKPDHQRELSLSER